MILTGMEWGQTEWYLLEWNGDRQYGIYWNGMGTNWNGMETDLILAEIKPLTNQ